MDIEYFWINDTELWVNGDQITPEQAYQRYPEYKQKIQKFVESTHKLQDRLDHSISHAAVCRTSPQARMSVGKVQKADMTKLQQTAMINEKITEIFDGLNIAALSPQKRAYALFEYVINNSKFDASIMKEKQGTSDLLIMEIQDIYKCLIEQRSVCSSDASALSLLYRRAGIKSCHLTIAEYGDYPSMVHEVVKSNINNQDYICDPTLVRTSLENKIIPNISPSVFAFTPTDFFKKLYPNAETKYEHESINF